MKDKIDSTYTCNLFSDRRINANSYPHQTHAKNETMLSYIIPIYNVDRYITACLDSIYAQDIQEADFEVICINDCSPDCSREIVREYQRKHQNLLLIDHTENRGLSAARNTGIAHATGKYIWFVDSDDMLLPNVGKQLCDNAIANDLDVLLFNYQDTDEVGTIIKVCDFFKDTNPLDGYNFVNIIFGDSIVYHMGYVVRFLLRREFVKINNLLFPEGEYWEDTVYFPKALLLAHRIASMDVLAYSYRHHASSISGGGKIMNAQKIYDFCFKAGNGLIQFADDVRDSSLALIFQSYAKDKYINSVMYKLLNTTPKEICRFVTLCSLNKVKLLNSLSKSFNTVTRYIVTYPYLMCILILAMHPIWRVCKLIKK